ncbi:MAG TPA: hypothetical protein VNM40_04105 [Candidatus Paceibacterota bacterium]|nr:hypothetical protein [Candidatus Paceibacterota bacterium]
MATAGVIFNWGIENTVVNFNTAIYGRVASGVQDVWIAFRDIANIIIIGIFVFVAIEMILGTTTFGGKKMVAKVLIVAILINFSMLFSRIIIETGNFIAGQFYKAVQLQIGAPAGSGANFSVNPTNAGLTASTQYATGISGRFSQLMGVTGFAQTGEALWKTANDPKNGGYIALLQGLLTAVIFLAAAVVFLYGTFLMVVRAIMLVFLMMTSSLAFASYLLPEKILGGYGWSTWWNALLRNVIFGPLLLIFLWATLKVGEGVARISQNGSIGGLIDSPANAGGIAALFGYLMILGMLFASIKIANSFSKSIQGFGFASALTAAPLALGSRFVAAPFLRQVVGRPAYIAQKAEEDRAKDASRRAAAARLEARSLTGAAKREKEREAEEWKARAASASRIASGFGNVAGSKMNIMDAGLVKTSLKNMGISGIAAGASGKQEKSIADTIKQQSEDAAKKAAGFAISEGDSKKMADDMLRQQLQILEKTRREGLKNLSDAKESRNARQSEIDRHQEQERRAQDAIAMAERAKTAARGSDREMEIMREEDAKIERARGEITAARDALRKIHKPVEDAERFVRQIEESIQKISGRNFERAANEMAEKLRSESRSVAAEIAPQLVQRTVLGIPVGRGVSGQSLPGKAASSETRKRIGQARIREQLEASKDILGDTARSAEPKT